MPRKPRVIENNIVYHVFNRRTDCQLLFPSAAAFDDFVNLIEDGRERYGVRICAYCVMKTHWHFAIWAHEHNGVTAVARFLRRLSAAHATRFRHASHSRGHGHVYQDRYKSKPVETVSHYLTLMRYIEANPLDAGFVDRAELWPWSSLSERLANEARIISPGPVPLPPDWLKIVNGATQFDDYQVVGDCNPADQKRGRR